MRDPLISVVIPVHNAAPYLLQTLESVRAQVFQNYELIVVDDCSTDDSYAIASGFGNVRCLRASNRGAAAARNTGIREARGRYVAFLDADDLWLPDKLERQAARLLANSETAWVYSDANVFTSAGRVICRIGDRIRLYKGYILQPLLLRSFIPSATPVVKRSALLDAGLFDEAGERRIGEDWSLWLRLAERWPIDLIDEPLALIRSHRQSSSQAVDPMVSYRSRRAILEQALARNPSAAPLAPRARAGIALSTGLRCLRRRRLVPGGRMLFDALKLRCSAAFV